MKSIGPKGQIVIPKRVRFLRSKARSRRDYRVRGDDIVISKPRIEGTHTEYYTSTFSSKLKERVDIKKIITEQVAHRHALH
jgi:bifunctional DNA-binding transcriptional regulator/antitoxin component of YhaV-PrlF toxin-antitoxin module